mmetsp:Transcript_43470/g.102420  ORF Transcript_43470/g.102420 Transcript_43470/m.102420 type:complete len:212 (+) Transcript_43470:152-787(+)
MSSATAVCIAVPKPRTAARRDYEALPAEPPELRRQKWLQHCLGANGCYVGRPKCDGGWYMAAEVKRGSIFANPFPLKDYPLGESLRRFRAYLEARMEPTATVSTLIADHFPAKLQPLLKLRFESGTTNKAASVAHFELQTVGPPFRARVAALKGCRLGCWCDPCDSKSCHAGVLAELVNSMADTGGDQQAAADGSRKRKRTDSSAEQAQKK